MPAALIIRKAVNGHYYFNLIAENSQTILTSETYGGKAGAQAGIQSVKVNCPVDARYQRKTAANGSPFFVLVAVNNEVFGRSEMYSSAAAMENGIASVKRNGPGAPIRDDA